jgi:hypothetical protein
MQHELLVDERKSCSRIKKNNGGMGIYEKRTHEHFVILRNFFRGGVVEAATLRSLLWLGSLTWYLRWRVVGPRCIGDTALSWRRAILGYVARATTIVAWTPCGTTWIIQIGIGWPWSLSLRRLRVAHDPQRAWGLSTRHTRWRRRWPHTWA